MPAIPEKAPGSGPKARPGKAAKIKGAKEAAAVANTPPIAAPAQEAPAAPSVSIRMYRGILGDCFLLTVRLEGEPKYILIDCGVLQHISAGTEALDKLEPRVRDSMTSEETEALCKVQAGPIQIREIAADVAKTTCNHLHLVVLTHEHYDHLSGFALARDIFDNVRIDQLWMSWVENPEDEFARDLRARFQQAKQSLALAMQAGTALGVDDERLDVVRDLSAFMGVAHVGTELRSTRDMIDYVRNRAGEAATRYLSPGEVIEPAMCFGLRAFVLGPPHNEEKLRKDAPSADPLKKEVYLTRRDDVAALAASIGAALRGVGHVANLVNAGKDALGLDEDTQFIRSAAVDSPPPFARPHRRGKDNIVSDEDPRREVEKLYKQQDFRKIDHEWMGEAEMLALKMDSDTNNTSLVLALELPDGQVLLFPGDAQVGNWLSWSDQSYPVKGGNGERTLSIDDIFKQVVFYKLGHHGSHNATLKALGLEKMTNTRLTAAIPVVEAVAKLQGKGRSRPGAGWSMPYPSLYADLRKRTKERIVRGDGDPSVERAAFVANASQTCPVTVEHDPDKQLWVELTFLVRIPTSA
jgi:hypothetical protein